MMLSAEQFERVRTLVANGDCVYPCTTCNESGCDECEGTGNVEAHVLLSEFAKLLFHEVERLRAENAELLKARPAGAMRDQAIIDAVQYAPSLAGLTDPQDPYPAELVGDMARAVVALEKELDDMGHYCIEQHVEYKRRRNEQHDAYDALHAALQDVLASAYPNERDHPTMSRAWQRARAFLARAENGESNLMRPDIAPKEGRING